MAQSFDLIVLGAGSGGVALARRAAQHGARVAIVEASRTGGTCVIRGCVPKKLLMYAASFADTQHDAAAFGWSGAAAEFNMAAWAQAKQAETTRLEALYRQRLDDAGVHLVAGQARFVAAQEVAVGDLRLHATRIAIATGASPVRDVVPGLADCPTSDDLLDLQQVPPRATILGGGYVAVEFASMLARLGSRVCLVFRDSQVLQGFDQDLRTRLAGNLAAAGVELRPNTFPQHIQRHATGWRMHHTDGTVRESPWVLAAVGRRANTAALALDRAGITVGRDGAVPVDARLQTPVAGIYAIGDVTQRKNLTPVAIAEGRWLADHLFGGSDAAPVSLDTLATAVFCLPPLATVGLTEAQCVTPTQVFEADFRPLSHAFSGRAERCYQKLLVEADSQRVVGIHMIGADAPEIVQSLAVAISAGARKSDFDRTMAVHPTLAEEFVLMRTPTRTTTAAAATAGATA